MGERGRENKDRGVVCFGAVAESGGGAGALRDAGAEGEQYPIQCLAEGDTAGSWYKDETALALGTAYFCDKGIEAGG